jgi:hypothetical protein
VAARILCETPFFSVIIPDITVTKENLSHEEIKRLNLGHACYYSVQNLLSSLLLSKKSKN